ncbi:PREDICTED: transcription factor IIIB 90 kDa subunit [Dinoponera quadriceps]|uniref:B-related factor 1 n=1 Tax=Dinoponera quadriceps TaxID=609295 RepID=A0A6P3XG17_DINQU|nr:PREDICTED: transcription factor IIIB 90 kDa subunit [Dinoponera quadriceps]
MSGSKCRMCGSTSIDTDPARGDAVCTGCGFVLEDQLIVSETTFEESPSGHMIALGQFVASDSTGGASTFGSTYHVNGKESRGITLQNARKGIAHICSQLRLNNYCIDTAMSFYKMALNYHLTRGRKQALNQAACVYITCRTERTAHMLIDISDVLQICVHELGRTYVKFAKALHINIPSIDPCLYIIRFANKLDFGDKTHEVSTTALRVVKRMKRDSIHSGRRPSGLCGAALLIAARLHEFSRSPADIIKIVKVHESTLRKRLIEFGDTPSSALTLDEFMTVDLEEEQDPPAFKAARKKDRERLQKLQNIDAEINELQAEIDRQLEEYRTGKVKKRKDNAFGDMEREDADRFIRESNFDIINKYVQSNIDDPDEIQDSIMENKCSDITGLGPDLATMGLIPTNNSANETKEKLNNNEDNCEEICIDDIDDEELDSYILSEKESKYKSALWNKVNADYLVKEKEKEEKRLKEKEEGKPEKKKRKTTKKNRQPANTPDEAIQNLLHDKKISSKINYEALKALNNTISPSNNQQESSQELAVNNTLESDDSRTFNKPASIYSSLKSENATVLLSRKSTSIKPNTRQPKKANEISQREKNEETVEKESTPIQENSIDVSAMDTSEIVDENDDYLDEEADATEMSVGQMLGRHGTSEGEDEDGVGYGYDEDEDY